MDCMVRIVYVCNQPSLQLLLMPLLWVLFYNKIHLKKHFYSSMYCTTLNEKPSPHRYALFELFTYIQHWGMMQVKTWRVCVLSLFYVCVCIYVNSSRCHFVLSVLGLIFSYLCLLSTELLYKSCKCIKKIYSKTLCILRYVHQANLQHLLQELWLFLHLQHRACFILDINDQDCKFYKQMLF